MEAVVLAGGKGTRLQQVVSDVPKPMAPVAGVPFLVHVFRRLQAGGVHRAVVSVGHMKHKITETFGSRFENLDLAYCEENEPLGTGGGIAKALAMTHSRDVYVLNGDCFFDISYPELLTFHRSKDADVTLGLKPMEFPDRYGTVDLLESGPDTGRVLAFQEKRHIPKGLVNAGLYCMNRERTLAAMAKAGLSGRFSIETDFYQPLSQSLRIFGFVSPATFIDIGIPEDYQRAQTMVEFRQEARS